MAADFSNPVPGLPLAGAPQARQPDRYRQPPTARSQAARISSSRCAQYQSYFDPTMQVLSDTLPKCTPLPHIVRQLQNDAPVPSLAAASAGTQDQRPVASSRAVQPAWEADPRRYRSAV